MTPCSSSPSPSNASIGERLGGLGAINPVAPRRREHVAGINRESIGESMANQLDELEDKDKSKTTKTMLKILVSPPCPSAPILSPPSFPNASIGNTSVFGLDLKSQSQTEFEAAGSPIGAFEEDEVVVP